jgi:hypothetical protein
MFMKKIISLLKITAIVLIIVSVITPFAYQMTQVFALDYAVEMHIKYKDGTKQSIFKTQEDLDAEALPDIKPAEDYPEIETGFTAEQVQEIDKIGGVAYDRFYVASVNQSLLRDKGYTDAQISDIIKMVEWYNSFKVLSVEVIDLGIRKEAKKASFGVTASAAPCEPKADFSLHYWGHQWVMDECALNDYKLEQTYSAAYVTFLGAVTPCSFWCAGYGIYQGLFIPSLEHASGQCEDGGAIVQILHGGIWKVLPNC